jgi:hypothetical protein
VGGGFITVIPPTHRWLRTAWSKEWDPLSKTKTKLKKEWWMDILWPWVNFFIFLYVQGMMRLYVRVIRRMIRA